MAGSSFKTGQETSAAHVGDEWGVVHANVEERLNISTGLVIPKKRERPVTPRRQAIKKAIIVFEKKMATLADPKQF